MKSQPKRTPYCRLQHRLGTFDQVALSSVEDLNKSASARVERITWNTIHRWLEKGAAWYRRLYRCSAACRSLSLALKMLPLQLIRKPSNVSNLDR
jgi:hypothetical protein